MKIIRHWVSWDSLGYLLPWRSRHLDSCGSDIVLLHFWLVFWNNSWDRSCFHSILHWDIVFSIWTRCFLVPFPLILQRGGWGRTRYSHRNECGHSCGGHSWSRLYDSLNLFIFYIILIYIIYILYSTSFSHFLSISETLFLKGI
jgi:hypothetical protein